MIMEILTGSGGILSYLQDILGGFCPRQQKRVGGGILSGGDFVLHSLTINTMSAPECANNKHGINEVLIPFLLPLNH